MTNIDALKTLCVALGYAKSVDKVKGNTVAEVILFMAENCKKSTSK